MKDEDRKRLEDAFAIAADLSGQKRDDFIAEFSTENAHLRDKLVALLDADGNKDDDMQRSVAQSIVDLSKGIEDPWIGKKLGAYTLKKRIGAGGMGAVFLAERTDDAYAQSVAIKIMSSQLLSDTAVARFKTERQILASLNHANIATLIDGGSTDDNLPYLVMQYVSGLNINDYCDQKKLPIVDRIKLFQEICLAVDYAHRNLIVHRDLKPSNILVGEDGTPKLLDFGIAKLIDPDTETEIAITDANARVLTPEYASPEQIRSESISIASDVYSLGVLLFKILTGLSPYSEKATTSRQLENAILETPPRKPSALPASLNAVHEDNEGSSLEEIGERRATSIPKLRQTLSGDLDNIVLKCLEKEPERRYVSARALAEDLHRYLRNEPVHAHGGDWAYKLRKFAVRQARPLAMAATALLVIVSLVTYYTVQLSQERNQALQAAIEAQRAAAQSREVSGFLRGLFESASPTTAQGEEITALELLDAGVERIGQLSDQPSVQAELLRAMGNSYGAIGLKDRSIELLERSIATLEKVPDLDPMVLAEAYLDDAENLRFTQRYEEAERQARRALELQNEASQGKTPLYAQSMGVLGSILNDLGRFSESEGMLLEARNILAAPDKEPTNVLLIILGDYANALSSQQRTAEALKIYQEITETSDAAVGALHPDSIVRYGNLAAVARRIGEYAIADRAAQIALERAQKVWTPEQPQLMRHMALASSSAANMGRFDEAIALGEKSVELLRDSPWVNSSHDIVSRSNLGVVKTRLGDLAAGERILQKLLADTQSALGEKHYLTLHVQRNYAGTLTKMGRYDQAEASLREIMESRESLPRYIYLNAQQSLAKVLSLKGAQEEADQLYNELIALLDNPAAGDPPIAMSLLPEASAHYRRAGQMGAALTTAERAVQRAQQDNYVDHYLTARAIAEISLAKASLGDVAEARREARSALVVLAPLFPDDDLHVLLLNEILSQGSPG